MEEHTNNQTNFVEFAKGVLNKLGWFNDPDIKGIFIVGSIATGANDHMSDIDLVVIADPMPSPQFRKQAYKRIGCKEAMINFYYKDSPVVKADITAVDKLWLDQAQIDICLCSKDEIDAYNYQPITTIKPCDEISNLKNFVVNQNILPSEFKDRINFCFRILKIHRNRYARWCGRKRWLSIDQSFFLFCVRDILLALNGYIHYNIHNPILWHIIENADISIPNITKRLEDIKSIDDRIGHQKKILIIDDVISDLAALCISKKITININDLE